MNSPKLLILFAILLSACAKEYPTSNAFDYMPEEDLLRKGVVNKYYEHFYPRHNTSEPRTVISYALLKKEDGNSYTSRWFNAGFEQTDFNRFTIEGEKVLLDSSVSFYGLGRLDTAFSEIKRPVIQIWNEEVDEGLLESVDYNGDIYEIEKLQSGIRDTTIMNQPAKVFSGSRNIRSLKRDTVFRYNYSSTMVKGFGLFNIVSIRADGMFVNELVEQMPVSKFEELRSHTKKRVAYINPENTIDDLSDFELCGIEAQIADYYNSDEDVRYRYDKGEMMKIIRANLEREKLKGESGYLTFRFVVNCEGKAGRFVTEQAGLNYQRKQFPQETVDHLYQITTELKEWRPSVIWDEPRDAYVYLTFKLQNGALIDVLP